MFDFTLCLRLSELLFLCKYLSVDFDIFPVELAGVRRIAREARLDAEETESVAQKLT